MARTPSPWFWEERNGWYITKDGQRHFLGEHPPDSPKPKKARGKWNAPDSIREQFHSLMAAKPVPAANDSLSLAGLFE